MKKSRLWILDADENMTPLYEAAFAAEFDCETFRLLSDLKSALAVNPRKPALLIADLHLPDGGFLDHVRENGSLGFPFIVVSGSDDASILERSFLEGASDFFVKPLKPTEMRVKTEKQLASFREETTNLVLRFEDWVLDSFAHLLSRRDRSLKVSLTQTEFKLVAFFFNNSHRSLTRDEIISALWRTQAYSARVLDFHLSKTREKMSELSLNIEYSRALGYRLRASAGAFA